MKKIFLLITFLLLLCNFAIAQQQPPQTSVESIASNFEKVVVKEHFITKKEIETHIDKKVLEYQVTTEQQLIKSFEEVEKIINSKINKFILKLVITIFSTVIFAGSVWYLIRLRLDVKKHQIEELKLYTFKNNKPPKYDDTTSESKKLKTLKKELELELKTLKTDEREQR